MRIPTLLVIGALVMGSTFAQEGSSPMDAGAERFRQFLASKHALDNRGDIAPSIQTWIDGGLSPLAYCGIRRALDNPQAAQRNALNIFSVAFAHPAESFCRASPVSSVCHLLANNCVTIGSSIFCDIEYLRRVQMLGVAALSYAWSGVRDGKRRGDNRIYLSPFRTEGLTDLARLELATLSGRKPSGAGKLEELVTVIAMESVGDSEFLDMLKRVSSILVLSHELAHVEQNACPAAQWSDKRRQDAWAQTYSWITCSAGSASTNAEVKADLRSIEIVGRFMQNDLERLSKSGIGLRSNTLGPEITREFERLTPIAREVALLAAVYSAEYQLLVHLDPAGGLELLLNTPRTTTLRQQYEYFISAGYKSGESIGRGHIEPALRVLLLAEALDVRRLSGTNPVLVVSFVDYRLTPFIVGRLQKVQQRTCKRPDAQFMPEMMEYVLRVFGRK